MIIWVAMIIPFATAICLYYWFNHKTVWWEFLIPLIASICLIGISKKMIEVGQTRDIEYWGGWVVRAEYYEEWDEEVEYIETQTDSDGNVTYVTKTEIEYHSPEWLIKDSNGITIWINQPTFENLCEKFGNRRFIDLHRSYYSEDGDLWVTTWKNTDNTLTPVTTSHLYENKVAVSDSVFNFPEVDPKTYNLYDYPRIYDFFKCKSILGPGDQTLALAEKKLSYWNAKLGAKRQVRIMILIFKNKPIQAGIDQQSYWKGGNKNEFVICVGTDNSNKITWCYPFSWTEEEILKTNVKQCINDMETLNLENIVDTVAPQIDKHWVRKEFADFDYLTIEPPTWAIFLTFFFTLSVNIGLSCWIIANEHEDGYSNYSRQRTRRHGGYWIASPWR